MAVYSCVSTLVLSSNPQVFVSVRNRNVTVANQMFNILLLSRSDVYAGLFFCFDPKQILSLVPELVNLFAQVVVSPEETSEVKAQVGRAFSHLISLYGQQMQPLLSNLSPAHANALAAFAPRS